jgi:hypothetical protein
VRARSGDDALGAHRLDARASTEPCVSIDPGNLKWECIWETFGAAFSFLVTTRDRQAFVVGTLEKPLSSALRPPRG